MRFPFKCYEGFTIWELREEEKKKVRDHRFAHETWLLKQEFAEWNETGGH